jgi:hypothetical protein
MDFEQLIEKINEYITTNGANEITGAKLNEVLCDIVNTVKSNILPVQVVLSSDNKTCTFKWPYEDTDLEDLAFDGYDGLFFVPEYKFPLENTNIAEGYTDPLNPGLVPPASEYRQGAWVGNLTKLEKGNWYVFTSPVIQSSGVNCIVQICRKSNN